MVDVGLFRPRGGTQPRYLSRLFGPQRSFVLDPSKRKTALCGRRGGKTEGVASWLLDGAEKQPGSVSPYIALSQKNARRIIWPILQKVARDSGLGADFNEQTLECRLPNGSRVWVSGCDDRAQCEDFRGQPYKRVAIDEAGSFPSWLEYLVEDVLDPALMDFDGELAMVGTPGLIPVGYFYDRSNVGGERAWVTHHWTCLDNPHVGGRAYLAKKLADNKWDEKHPTYVREYLGRWVRDDEALVYPYSPLRNAGTMPEATGRMMRVLSVDLGFNDPTAFVLSTSEVGLPDWYIERAWRKRGLSVAGIAVEIEKARERAPVDIIVVDSGGLGRTIVHDLQTTYGIPCVAAEKAGKQAAIHMLRGSLLAGTVHVDTDEAAELVEEWSLVAWNEDRDDHDEQCADDLCDAALYGYRAHGLHYAPEENPPKPGTVAADLAYVKQRKAELSRRIVAQQRRAGWRLPK